MWTLVERVMRLVVSTWKCDHPCVERVVRLVVSTWECGPPLCGKGYEARKGLTLVTENEARLDHLCTKAHKPSS